MGKKLAATRGPDRLILVAGALFFIDSFLPWYGVLGFNGSAWDVGGTATIAVILAIAATAFAAAQAVGAKMTIEPKTSGLIYAVLGGGTVLFTIIRIAAKPGGGVAGGLITRKYGIWVALILALVLAYGAYQKYQAGNK
jgi:hypothetical protein